MVGYKEMRYQSKRDPSAFSENGVTWHTSSPERFAKRTIHTSEPHTSKE